MTLTTWWTARPLESDKRKVAVGVLVPCSGSKTIEAAFDSRRMPSAALSTTVLMTCASAVHCAGPGDMQLQSAAEPVWIR